MSAANKAAGTCSTVRAALLLRRFYGSGHAALYTFRVGDRGIRAFLLLIASSLRPLHTPSQAQPSDPAQTGQIYRRRSPPLPFAIASRGVSVQCVSAWW